MKIFQQITIQPGGSTGWHTHPGKLLVAVKSGTITRYFSNCTSETYTAGQAFIETDDVHSGANLGSEPVELLVTYVVPAGGPLRVEADDPGCSG